MTTNDPDEGTVQLKITANIAVLFEFEPQRVNFNRLKRQEFGSMTVNGTGEQLQTVNIISTAIADPKHADYYEIKIDDSNKGINRQLKLTIKPTENIPFGRFNDTLKVTTDLQKASIIDVFISGEILGPIEVVPRSLILRTSSEGEALSGSITLKPTEKKAFNVLSAICKDSRAEISIAKPDASGAVTIEGKLPLDFSENRFQSKLVITTDVQEQSEFTVPVYAYWNRPGKPGSKPGKTSKGVQKH